MVIAPLLASEISCRRDVSFDAPGQTTVAKTSLPCAMDMPCTTPMPSGFVSEAVASEVTPAPAMRQLRVLICPASRHNVNALRGWAPSRISLRLAHDSVTLSPGPPTDTGPIDTAAESSTVPRQSFQPPFALSVVSAK
jgi:hypothetical protein